MKIISAVCLFISLLITPLSSSAQERTFKVLHVMSYHETWEWNIEQFQGFKDGIGDLNVEYKVVELDTKRDSDPASIQEKVGLAENLIQEWKPDLLYTNDDNAQQYIAQQYVGTDLPIVFSGVNRDPSEYGFLSANNVTGVMEYEHFLPTLSYLERIKPNIQTIGVIVDPDPTWKGVMARMRSSVKEIPHVKVTDWKLIKDFEEYKRTIHELQNKVDVIALLGIFNIKGKDGNDIDYEEVLKWTTAHSRLPDFSFWESRIDRGTLVAVAVSGYQQGLEAGKMARKILKDKTSPGDIPVTGSSKGQPMLNLKRAKALGIDVDVKVLLESKVKNQYVWDK